MFMVETLSEEYFCNYSPNQIPPHGKVIVIYTESSGRDGEVD